VTTEAILNQGPCGQWQHAHLISLYRRPGSSQARRRFSCKQNYRKPAISEQSCSQPGTRPQGLRSPGQPAFAIRCSLRRSLRHRSQYSFSRLPAQHAVEGELALCCAAQFHTAARRDYRPARPPHPPGACAECRRGVRPSVTFLRQHQQHCRRGPAGATSGDKLLLSKRAGGVRRQHQRCARAVRRARRRETSRLKRSGRGRRNQLGRFPRRCLLGRRLLAVFFGAGGGGGGFMPRALRAYPPRADFIFVSSSGLGPLIIPGMHGWVLASETATACCMSGGRPIRLEYLEVIGVRPAPLEPRAVGVGVVGHRVDMSHVLRRFLWFFFSTGRSGSSAPVVLLDPDAAAARPASGPGAVGRILAVARSARWTKKLNLCSSCRRGRRTYRAVPACACCA